MTPNYKLLGDAYAIVGGIPEERFDLDTITRNTIGKNGDKFDCKTIGCAFGWLGLHPDFQPLMHPTVRPRSWTIGSEKFDWYPEAAAALFDIEEDEATDLFGGVGDSKYDEDIGPVSDKQRWLKRVRMFLDEKGIETC